MADGRAVGSYQAKETASSQHARRGAARDRDRCDRKRVESERG